MAKVFIAIPCYGGMITAQCTGSLVQLTHALIAAGHEFMLDLLGGESLVQRARNELVHRFLKSDCTHLFFIDSDIQFTPQCVLDMLALDKPVIGGAYPKKTLDVENIRTACARNEPDPMAFAANYAVNVLPGKPDANGDIRLEGDRGAVPILDAPTGFLLIKRHVFVDMILHYPETQYQSDTNGRHGEPMFALFDCAIVDGRYLSEDYLFSRRWQKMGGTVWCYLPAVLGHVGTHTYRGDLSKTFRPQHQASEWTDIPSLPDDDPQRAWHLARYEWAAKRLEGRIIANAACGTGYGNPILARDGVNVVNGLDRSAEAIAIGQAKGYGKLLCVPDLEVVDLLTDSVVSLETIEHLKEPWKWVAGLHSDVDDLIISVPIIPTKHTNEFHLHDFTEADVLRELAKAGWLVKETEYQDEWVPKAVLLVHAVRP